MTSPKSTPTVTAPSTPTPAPASSDAVAAPKCADCGSEDVVTVTDGITSAVRYFCVKHRPVNLAENVL